MKPADELWIGPDQLPEGEHEGSPCLLLGCAFAVVLAFALGILVGILVIGARE
jgi:hypothetical protein